jgi:hypothetical protein
MRKSGPKCLEYIFAWGLTIVSIHADAENKYRLGLDYADYCGTPNSYVSQC